MAHREFIATTREHARIREQNQTRQYSLCTSAGGPHFMIFQNMLSSVGGTFQTRPVQYSCTAVKGCLNYATECE